MLSRVLKKRIDYGRPWPTLCCVHTPLIKSGYVFEILGPMGLNLWGNSVYSKVIIPKANISDKACSHK